MTILSPYCHKCDKAISQYSMACICEVFKLEAQVNKFKKTLLTIVEANEPVSSELAKKSLKENV